MRRLYRFLPITSIILFQVATFFLFERHDAGGEQAALAWAHQQQPKVEYVVYLDGFPHGIFVVDSRHPCVLCVFAQAHQWERRHHTRATVFLAGGSWEDDEPLRLKGLRPNILGNSETMYKYRGRVK